MSVPDRVLPSPRLLAEKEAVSHPRLSLPSPISRTLRAIRLHLPPLNFITVHYTYFIGVCLLSSIIFWGSSTPARSVNYTDSLFLVVSAMTLAGLNTINLSILNTFQQFILFLLILMGSAIWVSIGVVHIRRKAFERRFRSIVEEERQRTRQKRSDRSNSRSKLSFRKSFNKSGTEVDGVVVRGRAIVSDNHDGSPVNGNLPSPVELGELPIAGRKPSAGAENGVKQDLNIEDLEAGHGESEATQTPEGLTIDTGVTRRITFASPTSPTRMRQHRKIFAMQGIGARQNIDNNPLKIPPPIYPHDLPKLDESDTEAASGPMHSLFSGKFIGRNSQFSGLSLAEREKLGGVEYRAVTILSVIVPLYFILWQMLGCIGLGAYVAYNRPDAPAANAENSW